MSSGVIYSHTVEALMKQVVLRHGLLTPEFRRALEKLGVDADKPKDAPIATWILLLRLTAEALSPGVPTEQALFRLGRELVKGYAQGMVGAATVVLAKMLGPRRALLRVADHYKTADNAMEITVRELTPRHFEITFADSGGVPTYQQGTLSGMLELVGITTGSVRYELRGATGVVFTVTW